MERGYLLWMTDEPKDPKTKQKLTSSLDNITPSLVYVPDSYKEAIRGAENLSAVAKLLRDRADITATAARHVLASIEDGRFTVDEDIKGKYAVQQLFRIFKIVFAYLMLTILLSFMLILLLTSM